MKLGRSRASGQAGFSAIELIVSSALTLVVAAVVVSFNRTQLLALRRQSVQLDIQTTARDVVDLFAREVRRASLDPTCGGEFEGVAAANSSQIRIQSDLDGDGTIDGTNEDIIYSYDSYSNTVSRTEGNTTDVLLSGIDLSGSGLTYFDGDGAQIMPASAMFSGLSGAQRADIRKIRLELSIKDTNSHPGGSDHTEAHVSTDINLRNRFFIDSTACGGA